MSLALQQKEGLTLALNAAEGMLQLAIANEEKRLVYSQQMEAASRGAEILAPAIDAALHLLDKKPADIARIAAVSGPGSFTGLRLATTTAAGLARAVDAKQAPLNYMQIIARQCLPFLGVTAEEAHIWVLVRARNDLVYAQAFARNVNKTPQTMPITGLEVLAVQSGQAVQHILDMAVLLKSTRILLAGSSVQANRDTLVETLATPGVPRMTFLPIIAPYPQTLLDAALDATYSDNDIKPLYVRPSDAEENLPHIAEKLGIDPDEAVKKLQTLTREMPGGE